MKMISAVVKPFKLDDVREALLAVGVEGMTATEVRGYGRQKGRSDDPGVNSVSPTFLSKIKIDVAVSDKLVDKAVAARFSFTICPMSFASAPVKRVRMRSDRPLKAGRDQKSGDFMLWFDDGADWVRSRIFASKIGPRSTPGPL